MSKFARQLQFVTAFHAWDILMIKASIDLSRFHLDRPTPNGRDNATADGSAASDRGSAQAGLQPAVPQPLQRPNAGLADLKRLNQSLKPRRHLAAGGAQALDDDPEQSGYYPQQQIAAQRKSTARFVTAVDLPRRRPASLDDVRTMKLQSMLLIEQMAGPSARALLQSPIFQAVRSDR